MHRAHTITLFNSPQNMYLLQFNHLFITSEGEAFESKQKTAVGITVYLLTRVR